MGVFKRKVLTKTSKKEYWYIDYTYKGKRKWESVGKVGEVTKSDAKKLLALRHSQILKGELKPQDKPEVPLFRVFANEYLEYARVNKKSWDRDACALRCLVPFFGKYTLSEVSPFPIEKYKLKRNKTVSHRTINIELSLLRRMFNLAIDWDKCESNPMSKVKFYKEEPTKERILSRDEEERLLESCPEHIKPILITALNTGMRYGEVIGLTWQNIDFQFRYVHVSQSKTGKDRNIPMNEMLYKTLLDLIGEKPLYGQVKSSGKPDLSVKWKANY